MENLTNRYLINMVSDSLSAWPVVQEKSRHVLYLVKANPWTSLGVAAATALVWSYVKTPRNLPPGPSGYPLIGAKSCFSMDLPKKMLDWRDKYGEVISFYQYGMLNVILNSERTIKDAFVKQADDFSHRTGNVDLFITLGIDDELFTAPFNEVWKKHKKFAVSSLKEYGFGTAKSESKMHSQLQSLEDFISKTDGSPIDMYNQFKLLSAGTMAEIILGASGSWDDPDTKEIVRLTDLWYGTFGYASMEATYYEKMFIPRKLSYLLAHKSFAKNMEVNRELIGFLSQKIKEASSDISDRTPESVVDAYVKERGIDPEVVETMAKTILIFLPDAIETTSIITSWCLLYTILNQDVQEKLYKEVSNIIGTSRLPTLSDRAEMHYTQAVISETLRLTLVLPLSPKRFLKRDIKVDGYTLPKGAVVAGNFYAIHYDPEIFPDPFDFKPSRFLDADGKFKMALAGKLLPFSIGNRKCIGEQYVKLYIFFFITRIVQRFKLSFDPSAPTPTTMTDGTNFIARPQTFKVCFNVR